MTQIILSYLVKNCLLLGIMITATDTSTIAQYTEKIKKTLLIIHNCIVLASAFFHTDAGIVFN